MIFFDHIYCGDPGHKFLKRLRRLGFTLQPNTTEHPGGFFCRFIKFPAHEASRRAQYLEFVWGKKKGVGNPGFCFGYSGVLDRFQKKLERDGKLRSKLAHKNYDWKKDASARLPGWNFVTFTKLGLPHLNPWFTEYEPRPGKKSVPPPKHKNGAKGISGFVIELDAKGEAFFSYVLGKKLSEKVKLGGCTLYLSFGHRRTRVRAVVIEMKSLPAFLKQFKADSEGLFFGCDAARIENPDRRMWDLILV